MNTKTLKAPRMIHVTEIGRRAGVAASTVERRLAAAKVHPDAELTTGALRNPSQLFLEDRLPSLLALIGRGVGPMPIC